MSIYLNDLQSKETVLANMEKMNSFGLRLTGSKGQNDFCAWLKEQAKGMGYEVLSNPYKFDKCEFKDYSLNIDGEDYHISSPFPYSGLTPEEGVTAKLTKVHNHPLGFLKAAGKIAVVRLKNISIMSSKLAFNKKNSMPEGLAIEKSYKGPVSTSFVKTLLTFWAPKLCGLKGMICIWEGMSDEMVEGQVLNFILSYLKVPMVWVNESTGKKVLEAAKAHKKATLKLTGSIDEADTESFCCILKGTDTSTNEAIIVNTHTDGCNFCEENGPIGILALMDYFKKHPAKRTIIFAFVTGHFRLPNFRIGKMASNQATGRWLNDNKALWNGEKFKAVAGCSVEHLGCTEWKDVDGKYTQTNPIDIELVYTGNKNVDKIYYEALKDRTMVRTITVKGHNTMHFGEGQPLSKKHIPEIALVTAPDYLCAVDPTGNMHMDKFNLDLMYEQIQTFINCVNILDTKTKKEIGKSKAYSFGLGRLK
ncbi:MAG: hypothetical protein MJ068_01405 [Clostridia bacterium]|nr:hypothetical protein [Clostridia bacterium]